MAQPQSQSQYPPNAHPQFPHQNAQMVRISSSAFSPTQQSPIPAQGSEVFATSFVNNRALNSPGTPSQSPSPYAHSSHATTVGAASPPVSAPPTSAPGYQSVLPPQSLPAPAPHAYQGVYTNSNNPTSLNLPESRPAVVSTPPPFAPPGPGSNQYTISSMVPIVQPSTSGTMGPPSKPTDRSVREYDYDPNDMLAGTGIDIRQEEQALVDYFASSFGPESRTGFPANTPGPRTSFYGTGWASQTAQHSSAQSQDELSAQVADLAWTESATRLANIRKNELENPFLMMSIVHHKAQKISKEYGVSLNTDLKTPLGKMQRPADFAEPTITTKTAPGPDGTLIVTHGTWIPHDAYLCDQLALLSIATKHRLREKIEDADLVALVRQRTSHGEVPAEWIDVAAPLLLFETDTSPHASKRAVSPGANPLKRSFDAFNRQDSSFDGKSEKNVMTRAIRDGGKADRAAEEARLRRRQKRQNPETMQASSRATSVVPGTPASGAPEAEGRAPTRKEARKTAAARSADAFSETVRANQTLTTLIGGFGGKKKGKQYSWMTKSGAETPKVNAQDAGTSSTVTIPKVAEKTTLTQEGRSRLGTWRENAEKGKHIQLRDWVAVLELDGLETKAIQDAYTKLDDSNPK